MVLTIIYSFTLVETLKLRFWDNSEIYIWQIQKCEIRIQQLDMV